jgi:hypothetical protein
MALIRRSVDVEWRLRRIESRTMVGRSPSEKLTPAAPDDAAPILTAPTTNRQLISF